MTKRGYVVTIGRWAQALKRYRAQRLDAPPPPPPAPYVYAATEYRPRGPIEVDLCDRASGVDWIYVGTTVLADAGAVALDSLFLQVQKEPGVRLLGPSLIGLSWGFTLGGGYLALPKCSPDFVRAGSSEGSGHFDWPIAVSLSLLAAATAPVIVGIETGQGNVTLPWSTTERSMRLVLAGAGGAIGAFLPYLLPPKTWRVAKELERIRAGADSRGAFVSYEVAF
jgi:hypothetical protein